MNKRTEQTRWTPKRLLSLLMALIMTLSLLPTAVFANDETKTFYLNTFIPAPEEPESVAEVASGDIGTNGTRYRLSVHIDPKLDYAPGQKVDVRATADLLLKGGDQVDESHPLKVTVGNTAVTSKPNSSPSDSTSQTATDNSCTIGLDGSISFTTSIEYSVIPSGSSEAITGSKTVSVKIKDLWTGYNVTYTNDNGETFTGLTSTTAKTVAKDASGGSYEQVYTIPDGATASKDNCTFEGWRVSIAGLLSYDTQPGATLEGITGDVTLTTLLPENQEISFDPVYSGVSGLPYTLKATSTGSTYQILFTPQLANYTFNGWRVTGGTAKIDKTDPSKVVEINAPITLTPKWVPADGSTPAGSHSVKFVRNNATDGSALNWPDNLTGAKDSTVTIPWLIPQAEGYTFLGWSTTENATTADTTYEPGATVTLGDADITLYAVWQAKNYTISYTPDNSLTGVTLSSTDSSVTPGRPASFKVTVLAAYDASSMIVAANGVPLGYSAKTENTDGSTTYTYSFVPTGDTAVTVSQPEQKSYVVTLPVGDHFKAKFGGTDTKSDKTVTYNGSVSFTVNADSGWTIEDVSYTGDATLTHDATKYTLTNIKSNVAVSVKMKQIPVYTISYSIDEAYFTSQKVTGESANVTLITPAERTGYNFDGWYKNPDYTDKAEATLTVTGDVNLYGHYMPKTYSIKYDLNAPTGATVTPVDIPNTTKTYGLAATLTEIIPEQEGFTFLGWSESDTATAASYLPGATFSKEIDHNITLCAVWQKNTYTITFSSGEGYSLHSGHGSMTVEHNGSFEFNLIVDPAYAQNAPSVWANTAGINSGKPVNPIGEPTLNKNDGSMKYHYTLSGIKADTAINALVTANATYTVTFMTGTDVYQTQQVEFNHKATKPADPEVDGFTFGGWYKDTGWTDADKWDFATDKVTEPTTLCAKLTPIKPVITWPAAVEQVGYELKFTTPDALVTATGNTATGNTGTVAYNDKVTFTITVADGYDASKMQVGVNGILYAPNEKNGNVYTFEFTAKEDTKITITGIERKTVTVIYNANARDDVSGLPSPQVVKYYLAALGETGNDKITTQVPSRTGYTFLGWNTDSEAKEADSRYTAEKIRAGAASEFTQDTTLYAIWEAQDTKLTLNITDVALDKNDGKRVIQYEGESITLQAELNVDAKGTVVFYKGDKEGTNGTRIGSAAINGKTAELVVKVGDYKAGGVTEHYWAVFESETDEGYANSEKSNIMNVGVFSKAITWPLDTKNADTLTITEATGSMTAGKTYKLTVNITKILGLETVTPDNAPKLGEDYAIVWQYKNTVTGDWADMSAEITDTNEYQVTPEYAGHEYRAKIVPIGDLYTKAAKFDENGIVNNGYDKFLYTNTVGSVLQSTATALTIDAPEESKDIKINGDTPFTAIGEHKAQFEGQAVTLTAKVTKDGGTGVETGKVSFYRLASTDATGAQTWELISTVDVQTAGDNTGVASTTYTMGTYDSTSAGASATTNKETFKAVYVANETYEKSETDGNAAVYIKSAKLMTPIIESTLAGKLDDTNKTAAQATTYKYNLTELLAGVQHEFKLRQTGAEATTGDWSVVALDGRTVDADNYSIEWQYKTGDNFVKANNESTQAAYTTTTTKVGDRYRVKLTGNGVFAGSEATSKDAVIGTKQDVTVTVEATDAITKTPETDVYQLNEITLTATVAAANDKPTMQPTGTVTFYYSVDGNNWTKIGEAKDLAEVAGVMTASIKTDQLPVKANDNTKQDVKITAVYSGDATFNVSATVNETEKSITAAAGCTTTNDTVTVYSSVVFNCNDENKKQTTDGDKGIHISVSDGAFKANEKATLALSDIYTLDRELTDETLRNTIAKLNPTTDYTVQWQKLNGATAIGDAEGTDFANSQRWTDIGATGTTLVLDKVEQNTAYRAVITVNDQPITKGSSTEVNQTIKGRQVYYSNVLMPTDTNMTVSVALNTSKIGAENTEGITEGETVTANVFLSGVVGAVPNANVTVKVTNDSAKGNDTAYEKTFTSMNTVNGWNAFSWNTAESDDNGVPTAPGFYTLTVSATTNTGYAAKEITRSLIVRESSYTIVPENTTVTYNGRTQGLTVALNGFGFNGTGINEAANKSWTVKYYDKDNNLVEPTQAGTYRAVITLPASAYWTEQTKTVDFTIEKRSVSIADAIAQAKVYDGTTDVNIVEVMLNDAVTDQTTNGTGLPTNNVGIINGDSIYAVATEAKLSSANAGDNSFTISTIELRGDDANNYEWDKASYTENIYVSRSQVYGEHGTLELKQGETFPADKVIKMIDQSGREITLGTGTEDYTLTFYYHSDTKIEKTTDISKLGLYTVVARPNQSNYKSGVTMQFNVVETATVPTPATTPKASTLIYLNDTATKYNPAGNVPVTAKNAQGNTVKVEYHGTTWSETVPSYAGRYLVKATDTSTGDVAYGIYTITKAHPSIGITAAEATYNSMPYTGATPDLTKATENPEHYLTYAGDVAIGYNTPADGNVDEQAPVDAGTYTVTLHVNETANYTAHEISKSFTIAKKALTIKADSWQTTQYDAFPDMTAGYTGLAAETGDTTPDTSLRDVQIAPEFLYNPTGGKSNYSNDSLDQVGGVAIQPIDALSKNYAITYENGQYTKQRTDANIDLAIHGLPQSSTGKNTVYYGDEIQLYPYGYYTTHANGSGIFNWSVSAGAPATIDADKGILKVTGVGEFIVTLTRGEGELQISTSVTVTAIQKEAKIALKNVDKVYNGASQTYTYTDNVTVHNELYQALPYFDATKVTRTNTDRIDVGTQITTAKVTGAWAYQSETYGGKFTINDKDATVAPVAQSTVYGTLETFDTTPKYTVTNEVNSVAAVSGVNVASQTDAYNRLDVHDGYEILVAGTEDMNYNVKYTTDETAEDSAVTTYDGMKLYSTTTKAKNELNDATVYGEQANDLDWILDAVKSTTRDSETYADNLADFDLADTTGIFIKQDKDDCVGNAKTYKAANREEGNTSSTALAADRTATEKAADDNYELVFSSVTNAKAKNYRLDNNDVKNEKSTMTAPTGTVGFIGAAATSDNLIEGSANIAQRPIKLEKAVTDAQLYWRLPQSQLYTALVNILKAEENSVGRGLAKGHTIEDLDLSFTIKVGSTTYNVAKDGTDAINFAATGNATVTATVGDTNYKLEGGQYQFDIVLKNIQIEATYTTKTFTGFTVLIKVHNENGTITPLNDAKGLSYKIFKKTGNTIDKTTAYASGTLTYQNRTAYDDKRGLCGVFTATYPQLPLLNSGETYFIQMYEYGVELKTNS